MEASGSEPDPYQGHGCVKSEQIGTRIRAAICCGARAYVSMLLQTEGVGWETCVVDNAAESSRTDLNDRDRDRGGGHTPRLTARLERVAGHQGNDVHTVLDQLVILRMTIKWRVRVRVGAGVSVTRGRLYVRVGG